MAMFSSLLPSTAVMPGTYVASTSLRLSAPMARIMSSVMSVTGTGASSSVSSCCEAVTSVFRLTRFFSTRSAKRAGSSSDRA